MIYKTRIRIEDFNKDFILESEINDYVNNLNVGDRLQAIIKIVKKGDLEKTDYVNVTGEITDINNALAKEFYSNKDELVKIIVLKPYLEYANIIRSNSYNSNQLCFFSISISS